MQKKWVVAEKISDDIVSQLLYNRGLKDKNAIANFFHPPSPEVIASQPAIYLKKINPEEINKASSLIGAAVKSRRPIIIHGDYDVDGLCATAILYQTLKSLGAWVTPFIPDRFGEGYGLSIESLNKIQIPNIRPLLITADCGITAINEVKYAKSQGFDVIVTDHHTPGQDLPEADAIVWTDELSGAGVAWSLSQIRGEGLDLVALATIADIQPLMGINRALVKYGLSELNRTQSVGLRELIKISGLEEKEIGTYEVGWILGPRLNASGRLQHAVDSLNLLLTDDPAAAQRLALRLSEINQDRQQLTKRAVDEAKAEVALLRQVNNIIILQKETWHEGIIGLIAGRIREEFYRPTLVISQGEEISKGSARSVQGFNIVEAIRQCQEFLLDAGGHAMAAGFTIETEKIAVFRDKLQAIAGGKLSDDQLTPTLTIEAEVKLVDLTWDLMASLKKFAPFGVGNPEPLFLTRGVQVVDVRPVGATGQHLKLRLGPTNCSAIGFGLGHFSSQIRVGADIDIAYHLTENIWNGQTSLQLTLKDLQQKLTP